MRFGKTIKVDGLGTVRRYKTDHGFSGWQATSAFSGTARNLGGFRSRKAAESYLRRIAAKR